MNTFGMHSCWAYHLLFMNSSIDQDLARIALQEKQLQFDTFTADTALKLGMRLKEAVEARGRAVVIDIQLTGQPLFFYAMPGTTPDNIDWARRKRTPSSIFTVVPTPSALIFSKSKVHFRKKRASAFATTPRTAAVSPFG
jgi:uncharacterized protein (UPF0303 family)